MERGDFYASTGVEIADYVITSASLSVQIKESSGAKFRTRFVGRGGALLSETGANPAIYRFRGDELYVRAKVIDSNGHFAWLQPAWRVK